MDHVSADDALAGLNEAQREAVTHPSGPLLVLAGDQLKAVVAGGGDRPADSIGQNIGQLGQDSLSTR